jgi:hypothetical protein
MSLTGGRQHPGVEQRFEGEPFIAGPSSPMTAIRLKARGEG